MGLIVADIPVGTKLIDTTAMLTDAELAAFKAAGVDGIFAYLGGNLTAALLAEAQNQRMGVCPVNFSRSDQWIPTAALGTRDAAESMAKLDALGVPVDGLCDWCDLEGAGGDPTTYLNAWSTELHSDGRSRIAGLYVGAGGLLHATSALNFLSSWTKRGSGASPRSLALRIGNVEESTIFRSSSHIRRYGVSTGRVSASQSSEHFARSCTVHSKGNRRPALSSAMATSGSPASSASWTLPTRYLAPVQPSRSTEVSSTSAPRPKAT